MVSSVVVYCLLGSGLAQSLVKELQTKKAASLDRMWVELGVMTETGTVDLKALRTRWAPCPV